MDARSEHQLFEHVRRLEAGHALVLISHRFSTVRDADRIYVLDKGRIIEPGSHAELIDMGGRYAELFRAAGQRVLLSPDDPLRPPVASAAIVT